MRFSFHILLVIVAMNVNIGMMNGSPPDDLSTDEEADLADLRALATRNPEKDFAAVKSKRDLRFLAIREYAVVVPGVPDYYEKYAKFVHIRLIRGTTDAIRSDAQRRIQDAVRRYAETYNKLVVDYLRTRNLRPK